MVRTVFRIIMNLLKFIEVSLLVFLHISNVAELTIEIKMVKNKKMQRKCFIKRNIIRKIIKILKIKKNIAEKKNNINDKPN